MRTRHGDIGLYIGSTGIKMAQATRSVDGTIAVSRLAHHPLPAGAVSNGEIHNVPAVAEAIRAAYSKGRFKGKTVVPTVSGPKVRWRSMDVDWTPPQYMAVSLPGMVNEQLPVVRPSEHVMDYYALAEWDDTDGDSFTGRKAQIALTYTPSTLVDSVVDAVQSAGLRLQRIDCLFYSLIRATQPVKDPDADTELIIHVGAEVVAMVWHHGGVPARCLYLLGNGSAAITAALAKRFDTDHDSAEEVKLSCTTSAAVPDDNPQHQEQRRIVSQHIGALIGDIQRQIEIFTQQSPTATGVDRIVLTGGGCHIGGLADQLAASMQTPVVVIDADTFTGPDWARTDSPATIDYTAAIGAAVRAA